MMQVHVLTEDDHVVGAAKALDASRFELSFSTKRASALSRMRSGCDVAVIDLRSNGFAVARDLKAHPSTQNVSIVMLCDRAADRWLCLQAGGKEVLVKPLSDPTELTSAVERLVANAA
jgi:DNA-binding response OmpR family regulator